MIQFEIGKTYVSSECIKYTVIKRSDSFLTLQFQLQYSPVQTIRKKINIERDRERINLDNKYHYILANWIDDYHPSDVAQPQTSQHAKNETAQQDNDSVIRFEVGKTYRCVYEAWRQTYTVIKRTAKTITVTPSSKWIAGDDDSPRLFRVKVMDGNFETFKPHGNYSGAPLVAATRLAQTPATPSQPATTQDDSATAETAPAETDSTLATPEKVSTFLNSDKPFIRFELSAYYLVPIRDDGMSYVRIIDRNDTSITVDDIATGLSHTFPIHLDQWQNYSLEYVKAKSTNARFKKADAKDDLIGFPAPEHPRHPVFEPGKSYSASKMYRGKNYTITFNVKHRVRVNRDKYSHCVILDGQFSGTGLDEPQNLAVKVYRLNPSAPEDFELQGLKFEAVNPDETPATVQQDSQQERPCFTIVPSEHIERPEYAQYPDTIPDDIPYHVITAIDTPQPAPAVTTLKLAGLPRVNAAIVRTWLHFVAFLLKIWLLARIPSFPHSIPDTVKSVFRDTRALKGSILHKATARNARAVLNSSSQQTLAAELGKLSVSALKRIGKCLGLLHQREKGSAQSLAETLAARLFEHRTAPPENSHVQQQQAPKTYTNCNRQIVLIFD